ncbi:hypothetical protein BDV95DRAFT_63951 [Massariosphaeria phaeospora]|uniref:Heterokaryon incompatibility domain-containing protein n=1 Tax=Massariosphaeria phaeospora TaxID=100035 RepID=A0A7C8I4D7_9PLEO|nr:hypothetical protein BDV95DRAFT_63951 [Massariosphaeria phaeospora]
MSDPRAEASLQPGTSRLSSTVDTQQSCLHQRDPGSAARQHPTSWEITYWEIHHGNCTSAQKVLMDGADPNATNCKHAGIVCKLPSWNPRGYFLPIIAAATRQNENMFLLLHRHGARFEITMNRCPPAHWTPGNPLIPSIQARNFDFVRLLLRHMDAGHRIFKDWLSEGLHTALLSHLYEIAEALLDSGAELAIEKTPVFPGNAFNISQHLITLSEHYATLSIAKLFGKCALRLAVQCERVDLCRTQLLDGAEVNSLDVHGTTALHVSAGNSDDKICTYLLTNGANVHTKNSSGVAPLLEAVWYGHRDVVCRLLDAGADPNAIIDTPVEQDPHIRSRLRDAPALIPGYSAMHVAAYRGFSQILWKLVDYGAFTSYQDERGTTILDIAMETGRTSLCYELLRRGFPFNSRSTFAKQLLEQYVEDNNHEGVALLIQAGLPHTTKYPFLKDSKMEHGRVRTDATHSTRVLLDRIVPLAADSSKLKTTLPFCQVCTGVLRESARKNAIRSSPWTSIKSCQLCQLLHDEWPDAITSMWPKSFRLSWDSHIRTDELIIKSEDGEARHNIKYISDDWHRFLSSTSLLEDSNTSSPAATAMAIRWLHTCVNHHRQCNTASISHFCPTRVLDIGGNESGDLKLVQPKSLSEPYVALSHRWGIEGLPRTTTSNIDVRLRSISLVTLSRTIKDAISIVRELGFRYLWVDALCIVQDSEEDWLAEASRMASVYSSAILTIAVADSENHSEGIFRARQTSCLRPFHIDRFAGVPYRERDWCEGEGEHYIFPSTTAVLKGSRPKGPLDSRGWVLQEQLLSRRILYYGRGELYWDCITMSASESSPISTSLLTDANPEETWALKLIRRTLAGTTGVDTLQKRIPDAWIQVVINYSARKLTKRRDKLIAMDGILDQIGTALQDGHIAGIWRAGLSRQLLWWTEISTSYPQDDGGNPRIIAPSWSWLSVDSSVFYHNSLHATKSTSNTSLPKWADFAELLTLVQVLDVRAEQLPRQMGVCGSLTLAGLCFKYRLTPNDMKKTIWKQWNKAKLKINPGRWMLNADVSLPMDVECLVMAEDSVAKLLVVLCLIPADDLDGSFRRIGLCHWDGLRHQIEDFASEGVVERKITIV